METKSMQYGKTLDGIFLSRPNRFIAFVDVNGIVEKVHVKNTGRCRELLLPGAKVVLYVSDNPARSTAYDLIAVWKGDRLVNIDSQAPNAVVKESFSVIHPYDLLIPEYTVGESRFDFYAEFEGKRIFAEVKGVTQEFDNHVVFPDAPTERGLKHVRELTKLALQGELCLIIFVIQMKNVDYFAPNYDIHDEFGKALEAARDAGVRIIAYDCEVEKGSMGLGKPVEVRLGIH